MQRAERKTETWRVPGIWWGRGFSADPAPPPVSPRTSRSDPPSEPPRLSPPCLARPGSVDTNSFKFFRLEQGRFLASFSGGGGPNHDDGNTIRLGCGCAVMWSTAAQTEARQGFLSSPSPAWCLANATKPVPGVYITSVYPKPQTMSRDQLLNTAPWSPFVHRKRIKAFCFVCVTQCNKWEQLLYSKLKQKQNTYSVDGGWVIAKCKREAVLSSSGAQRINHRPSFDVRHRRRARRPVPSAAASRVCSSSWWWRAWSPTRRNCNTNRSSLAVRRNSTDNHPTRYRLAGQNVLMCGQHSWIAVFGRFVPPHLLQCSAAIFMFGHSN